MNLPVEKMLSLLDVYKREMPDKAYLELMNALGKIYSKMRKMSEKNDENTRIISVCAKNINAGNHVIYQLTDKVTFLEKNVAGLEGYNKSLKNKVAGLDAYIKQLKWRIGVLRAELKGGDQSKDEGKKQHVFPLDQPRNEAEQDLRAYDDIYHKRFCKGRIKCECKLSTK